MTTVSDIDKSAEVNGDPVDLDIPSPALKHWEAIANNDLAVLHDGDASKIIAFPRPPWSDPDEDYVSRQGNWCGYNSSGVYVAASNSPGRYDDDVWVPAHVRVRAKLSGSGYRSIGILLQSTVNNKWVEHGINLAPEEALELADVLRAAVALIDEEAVD